MKRPTYRHVEDDVYEADFGEPGTVMVKQTRERCYPGLKWGAGVHMPLYVAASEILGTRDRISTVLDVPCGSGYGSAYLRNVCGYSVQGFDIDPTAVRFATLSYGHGYAVGDLTDLPQEQNDLNDAIVCIEGIEHVENDGAAMASLVRCLRPGGTLFITTPIRGYNGRTISEYHTREYSEAEFGKLLADSGLRDAIRIQLRGFEETMVVVGKK